MTTTSLRTRLPQRPRLPQPVVAAILSFLCPGLGQAYLRQTRWAAALGLPAIVLALYVGAQLFGGVEVFAVQLLDPAFAVAVMVWTVIVGALRLGSIGHVYLLATAAERASRSVRGAVIGLLIAVVAMHGVIGYYAFAFYEAGSEIFVPADEPGATDPPVAVATATPQPTPSLEPGVTASPEPTPRPPTNRITFLLTGVDSGFDRNHALPDTLLAVSVDTVDKTAVMLSLPRDLSRLPMYSGGTYNDKINSLLTTARLNPSKYPDGPMGTLTREIGFLIGIQIDYYAQINLEGFEKMVNLVGGIDVNNPKWINDPAYDWFDGTYGFTLSPGKHHLNGRVALAYVRTRQGAGDNDFTRARRQQQVIGALRVKMTSPAMLQKLPDILKVAAKTIKTDFPADQINEIVALGKEIPNDQINQGIVLGPPYAYRPATSTGTYYLLLDMAKIAKLSTQVFGTDSNYYGQDTSAAP